MTRKTTANRLPLMSKFRHNPPKLAHPLPSLYPLSARPPAPRLPQFEVEFAALKMGSRNRLLKNILLSTLQWTLRRENLVSELLAVGLHVFHSLITRRERHRDAPHRQNGLLQPRNLFDARLGKERSSRRFLSASLRSDARRLLD